MASHGFTYVPSKDLNPNVRRRAQQIQNMTFAEVKEHVRSLQRDVNSAFTKFQRLCTYDEMIASGLYWRDFAQKKRIQGPSIKSISSLNLYRCTKELEHMPPCFIPFLKRLESFPWVLKHNTKPDHIDNIKKERLLLGLTEIHRRGLGNKYKGGTDKGGADDRNIHNEDFVFFRLSFGLEPSHSRFGSECLIFEPTQLFKIGWVSMFDMLSPDSTDNMAVLHSLNFTKDTIGPQKKSIRQLPLRCISSPPLQINSKFPRQCNSLTSQPRVLHRAEIVFFGPDIRLGVACSALTELFLIGGPELVEQVMQVDDPVLARIISNLFWIEAKIPRFFGYAPSELLAAHSNVKYTKSTFE